MEEIEVIQALAALAQDVRLRLFRALVVAGPEGMTPGELSAQLSVAPTTLSFHLKELLRSGLLLQARKGRNLIYRADYARMGALMAYLTENCCAGTPCIDAAPSCTKC